jgi:hypothetical protein
MGTITISVENVVGDLYCVDSDSGQKVYGLIKKRLLEDGNVELSFQNIEMITTAFLSTAIGQLYNEFSEEFINQKVKVVNISKSGSVSLKHVIETAKLYYKDPEALHKSINEILED